MIGVTLKGLLGRKFRAILTGLAVVLGVAMVSGTYVLTDTISKAFDNIFSGSYKNTAAVISGKQIVKFSSSGNATVPASLLSRVKQLPDVDEASGQIFDLTSGANYAKLIDRNGKTIGGQAPTLAFGFDGGASRFNPLTLTDGTWASGNDEVVIDAATGRDHHFEVGDRMGVSAQGPIRSYRVAGIAKFGNVDSLGGATFAVFDVPTAQMLLHKEGVLDAISVASKPGVSPQQLKREIQPILPASAEVRTGAEQAQANAKDTKEFTKLIQLFLLAFGGIALFVGAFVIFNTLSITVAQRAREFATLRTLGASRRQVLRSVLLEGIVIGAFASVAGLFLGLALAKGMSSAFAALGLDLPKSGTVFATRTVVVSLALGIVITLIASLAPALRATRVPPILAVREGAQLPPSRIARFAPAISAVTVIAGLLFLAYAMFVNGIATKQRLAVLAVGLVVLFVGVALLSSRIVRPLAALVGVPAERTGGVAGRLARENSVRNPDRTASTAAALMIGLALVTVVASLGAGLRQADKDALNQQVRSDYVVTSKNGFDPFPVAAGEALASVKGLDVVSDIRNEHARLFRSDVTVDGVDPNTITQVFQFKWVKGSADPFNYLNSPPGPADLSRTLERDRPEEVRRQAQARARRPAPAHDPGRQAQILPGLRDLLTAQDRQPRSRPGLDRRHEGGIRSNLRPPEEHLHPRQRKGRRQRRDNPRSEAGAGRISRRQGTDEIEMGERTRGRSEQAPQPALRAPRPLGGREPVRNGEHARALRLRANPRTRDAPSGRHDPPANPANGSP